MNYHRYKIKNKAYFNKIIHIKSKKQSNTTKNNSNNSQKTKDIQLPTQGAKLYLCCSMVKHLDIIIKGKVQGVSFRASAKAVADQLGVRGSAKNKPDGTVAIEAEAEEDIIDMFLEFCHEGSDYAHVEEVIVTEGEVKNYRNFEVLKR